MLLSLSTDSITLIIASWRHWHTKQASAQDGLVKMQNVTLCFMSVRGFLMSAHSTSAQASAVSSQANCYCARWTPSFYQLPSSEANYPIPPCLCLSSALLALQPAASSQFFACQTPVMLITLHALYANVGCICSFFFSSTLKKLTLALVRGDVALLIVWHLPPPAIVVFSFSTSRPPSSKP